MNNYKLLLFAQTLDNTVVLKDEQNKQAAPNSTGLILSAKYSDQLNRIKAHITVPAINMITKELVSKYGRDQAKEILKDFFLLMEKLTKNNTALLSLYLPDSYLADELLEDNN